MQDLLRKHKRAILVFIILVMVIPIVFLFGMPGKGRSNYSGNTDREVANVGGVPVMASAYVNRLEEIAQRQSQPGKRVSIQDLDKNGMAERILQSMTDAALISLEEKKRGFDVGKTYLENQIKQWEDFQKDGKFDVEAWNTWVQGMNEQKRDWNEIYKGIKESVSRQIYMATVTAPAAYVSAKDIDKELNDNHTKIKMKYVKIDPVVEPTPEQIQAYYDANKESYKKPDALVVEFAALSLRAPVPQKALDIIKQAREGADFAKLADEMSEIKQKNGGDMGWQKPEENVPPHRKPIFELPVGQISEPVYAYGSYFIYKVEEERTDPASNVREVHARQIMIKAQLAPEEKAAITDKANSLAAKANEAKALQAPAQEAGLTVLRTNTFTKESAEIENIDRVDASAFRMAFESAEKDASYNVVNGRESVFVAKVVQREVGVIPPLEEVREKAKEDTIADLKTKDEFKNRVKEYADKIKAQAKSLDEIATLFPELGAQVKETAEPFTRKDYLYKEQLFLQPTDIYEAIGRGKPGTVGGPLQDFRGETFFVQLVEKTPPTEEDKKGWEKERKDMIDQNTQNAMYELSDDYCQFLREKAMSKINITIDQPLIDQILGRNDPAKDKPVGDSSADALNRLNAAIGN